MSIMSRRRNKDEKRKAIPNVAKTRPATPVREDKQKKMRKVEKVPASLLDRND